MNKAYSYLRFSTPEQAHGDSARRQMDLASAYAIRHGLELDEKLTFQDTGVSAFRGRNAEEGRLADFLAAVKAGVVASGSYLLVENLDRISRQTLMRAMDTLRALVDAGVVVVTLTDEARYTKESIDREPMQFMMAIMTFARANEESALKARRVRAAWERKKKNAANEPLTKVCPAWLRLKDDRSGFDVVLGRDAVVQRIFQMAADGAGQDLIAKTFNAEGIAPFGDHRKKPGAYWHRTYVSKILKSDAVLGTYVPHTTVHLDGRTTRVPSDPVLNYYPPVVDAELVRRARLVLAGKTPLRGRHARNPVQNILGGLATCPLCKGTMTRVSKGSKAKNSKPYFACTKAKSGAGCRYKSVPYEDVESTLRSRAEELVYKPTVETTDYELEDLISKKSDLVTRINHLLDLIESGNSTFAIDRIAGLEGQLRDIDAAISSRASHLDATREPLVERRLEDLREALMAEPFDRSRANAALRLCVSKVVVDFVSGYLLVNWRHGGTTEMLYAWPEAEIQKTLEEAKATNNFRDL